MTRKFVLKITQASFAYLRANYPTAWGVKATLVKDTRETNTDELIYLRPTNFSTVSHSRFVELATSAAIANAVRIRIDDNEDLETALKLITDNSTLFLSYGSGFPTGTQQSALYSPSAAVTVEHLLE
ncbi:MAG: hypothetical protein WBI40_13075 [Methylococcaceae bacterium]